MATGLYYWKSILLSITTVVYAGLTLANVVVLFLIWRGKMGVTSRIYLTTAAAALCVILGFMAYWDLIGMRLWAY
jgi:hypothetical protein